MSDMVRCPDGITPKGRAKMSCQGCYHQFAHAANISCKQLEGACPACEEA